MIWFAIPALVLLQSASRKGWIWKEDSPPVPNLRLPTPQPDRKQACSSFVPRDPPRSTTSGFGHRLAVLRDVDGDGVPDLAIGAPLDRGHGIDSGCVFVVSGADGHLIRRFAGDHAGDRFGISVSSSPDVDGDGADDVLAGSQAGYMRVLSSRSGSVLHEFPDAAAAVAIDLDRGGVPNWDWIVGTPRACEPGFHVERGAVAAFSGREDGPRFRVFGELPAETPDGTRRISWFGRSVCTVGDLDGDGIPDFAVGASGAGSGMSSVGEIRFCSGRDGSTLRAVRGPLTPRTFGLGERLAPAGDVDGDGVEDVLASTWDDGPVYVLSSRSGERLRTLLHQRPGQYLEGFGDSIALAGDVDGDGIPDYAVGCSEFLADSGDPYCVELFSGREGWVLGVYDTDAKSATVAEGRDFDLDGIPDLPVGLPELDEVVVLSGRQFGVRTAGTTVQRSDWWEILVIRRDQFP
jgi:hypothetical protein